MKDLKTLSLKINVADVNKAGNKSAKQEFTSVGLRRICNMVSDLTFLEEFYFSTNL